MSSLTPKRKLLYGLLAAALAFTGALLLLLAADVFAHARTQDVAGVNMWGYRGRPMSRKQPGEVRVAMLGGSTAFGWGLPASESIPAFLERRLNLAGRGRFSVVNLGAPGQGAYGFLFDLQDFEYLEYDVVCLYEGYNDVGPLTQRGLNNYLRWRRESPVFRWTGYYPILPVVLREKAQVMVGGPAAGKPGQVVFNAGIARRTVAGAMSAVADATRGLGSESGALSPVPPNPAIDDQCIEKWRRYCGSVREAIDWALAHDKRVIFVTQPYVSDAHIEQQANVAAMLHARFGHDPRVRYLNLGRAIDLHNAAIAYDGLHLVAAGNDTIAAQLVEAVVAAANQ
jgi:hypothetical protein